MVQLHVKLAASASPATGSETAEIVLLFAAVTSPLSSRMITPTPVHFLSEDIAISQLTL
jgi:hypothetical protein